MDSDILGSYELVATLGGIEGRDGVQLRFPGKVIISISLILISMMSTVPPSSIIIPTSISINESSSAQFQCITRGTNVTAIWQSEGGLDLPNGVSQEGNNLIIVSASRSHAGLYECVVRSSFGGTALSSATLQVFCELVNLHTDSYITTIMKPLLSQAASS